MRTAKPQEAGAALLTVLLLVALMSVAALAMMQVTTRSIQRAKAVDGRSQASWQMTGAEQAGLVGIRRLMLATNGNLYDGIAGVGAPFEVFVNGAEIVSRIEEASNCFNLNALAVIGDVEEQQTGAVENYRWLLEASGFSDNDVERLTDTLLDWIDNDNTQRPNGAEDSYYSSLRPSYLSAGTRLSEVSELRAIRGYSKKVTDQIGDLLCAHTDNDMAVLNVNTLKPEQAVLLSMAFSGELSVDVARDIILSRPLGGWPTVEDMSADDRIQQIAPDLRQVDFLSIRSSYLALEGVIAGRDHDTDFSILYVADDNIPARIVARSFGGRS